VQQQRVTLVISSLGGGGAERILAWLANQWVGKGLHVTIITLAGAGVLPRYELHPEVKTVQLGINENARNFLLGLVNNVKRILVLRRAIKASHPDRVLSFMDRTNVSVLLALLGCKLPIIVSEHTNPDYLQGRIWHLLRRVTYPLADQVVVLTERTQQRLSFVQGKTSIIPNPVTVLPADGSAAALTIPKPAIFAMGRLVELKRFDLLIRAFAEARKAFPDWALIVLGEGPERVALEQLVRELRLEGAVILAGQVETPEHTLRYGDLFVLSSRYEGFPNALCEAMACGLPVIATDCPTGPREIIRHGIDGLLVPNGDADALCAAMQKLMGNSELRKSMAVKAVEIRQRLSPDRIFQLWHETVVGTQGGT